VRFTFAFPALVLGLQHFANLGRVVSKIVQRDEATGAGHVIDQHSRGLPAVKFPRAVFCNASERGGQFGLAQRIPGAQHLAVTQENMAAHREALQPRALLFDFSGEFFAHQKSLFRHPDGRGHHVGELQSAVGLQGEHEARDRPRDGYRAVANHGPIVIGLAVRPDVHVARGFTWRHFPVVQEVGMPVGQVHEHETAAADVTRGRFDNRQGEGHGHSGIDSVSAALQDFRAGLRAEFFIARNHAVRRPHRLLRPAFMRYGARAILRGGPTVARGSRGQWRCHGQAQRQGPRCGMELHRESKTLSD
jgi:hypothetical protein